MKWSLSYSTRSSMRPQPRRRKFSSACGLSLQPQKTITQTKVKTHAIKPPYDFACSGRAYSSLRLPHASQLENFQYPPLNQPPTLMSPHLMGAGIGGQFAHKPSSKAEVRSKFNRKKGTTSVVPALVTVLLPQLLKVLDASAARGVSGLGAFGWSAKFEIVVISLWKWVSKGSWKDCMMRRSSSAFKSCGVEREVR